MLSASLLKLLTTLLILLIMIIIVLKLNETFVVVTAPPVFINSTKYNGSIPVNNNTSTLSPTLLNRSLRSYNSPDVTLVPLKEQDTQKIIDSSINQLKQINSIYLFDYVWTNVSITNADLITKIKNAFIQYVPKDYKLLDIQTLPQLNIQTNYNKLLSIPVFIYNQKINFVIRFLLNITISSDNKVTIKDLTFAPNETQAVDLNVTGYTFNTFDKNDKTNINLVSIKNRFKPLITKEITLKAQQQQIEKEKIRKTGSCFGIPQSEQINDQQTCEVYGGTWDTVPTSNEQCPFYLANKNYPNQRGGIGVGGYCDMPSGIQIVGYTKYQKEFSPICYNCKTNLLQGTQGYCCDQQANPDYKFPGDSIDRLHNKDILQKLNLSSF